MTRFLLIATLLIDLLAQPLTARAASPDVATDEEKHAAQKMFEAGDGLYESGRYEDAIVAFKNSHHLVASPNSRLMLARSMREAGHYAEACAEFRGVIRDAEATRGRYPEALSSARSELDTLESSLGQLELDAKFRERLRGLSINGKTVAPLATSIAIPAGTLQLEYWLKDGSHHSTTVELAKGEHKLLKELEFAPQLTQQGGAAEVSTNTSAQSATQNTRSDGVRTAAWVSTGVAAAGLTSFGVFGLLNRKAFNDLESNCPADRCSTDSADTIDAGRRYQRLANLGLGVAIVGTAAATTLFIVSMRKQGENPAIALNITNAGVQLDGKF